MSIFLWEGWRLEIDQGATRSYYAHAPLWDCTCGHCRNFMALALARRLPEELLERLDSLGIPPEKATYVCECYHQDQKLLYDVTYRLGGRVLETPKEGESSLWCGWDNGPTSAGGFPPPHFDMTMQMWLPWVLDEPVDGPKEAP